MNNVNSKFLEISKLILNLLTVHSRQQSDFAELLWICCVYSCRPAGSLSLLLSCLNEYWWSAFKDYCNTRRLQSQLNQFDLFFEQVILSKAWLYFANKLSCLGCNVISLYITRGVHVLCNELILVRSQVSLCGYGALACICSSCKSTSLNPWMRFICYCLLNSQAE